MELHAKFLSLCPRGVNPEFKGMIRLIYDFNWRSWIESTLDPEAWLDMLFVVRDPELYDDMYSRMQRGCVSGNDYRHLEKALKCISRGPKCISLEQIIIMNKKFVLDGMDSCIRNEHFILENLINDHDIDIDNKEDVDNMIKDDIESLKYLINDELLQYVKSVPILEIPEHHLMIEFQHIPLFVTHFTA